MKHLQNNFTTPEQSKRLLELGLPKDSADCYLVSNDTYIRKSPDELRSNFFIISRVSLPSWSVGRLIEIITICDTEEEWEPTFEPDDNILEMVFDFISENHNNRLDFSKLED